MGSRNRRLPRIVTTWSVAVTVAVGSRLKTVSPNEFYQKAEMVKYYIYAIMVFTILLILFGDFHPFITHVRHTQVYIDLVDCLSIFYAILVLVAVIVSTFGWVLMIKKFFEPV